MTNKEFELTFEFDQFFTKLKTNFDISPEKIDDMLLITSVAALCSRYFFIADDRQFYLMKSYLLDLMSTEDDNEISKLYNFKVSRDVHNIIFSSFNSKEQDAMLNMFGKGAYFPFSEPALLIFAQNAYEDNNKPLTTYRFTVKINDNRVKSNLKMPLLLNPTKIFTPLMLAYILEYAFYNFKQPDTATLAKKTINDMLQLMNDRKFSEFNLVNGVLIKNQII